LRSAGFSTFLHYPQVRIDVEGCSTFDDHLSRIGRKRRHNLRQERKLFEQAGARVEVIAPPIDEDLARKLHSCLMESSRRNEGVEVPFEDVLNSQAAFVTQHQWVIVAYVGDTIAGFFAFIPHEGVIAQCHGGFDYEQSLPIKAYPNLIHAAVEYAINAGYRQVTLGPLNNEAKRRAGSLAPVMSGIWCRSAVSRFMMDKLFIKRLQIYYGEVA
jgi:predicted N-acyltransferase